MTNFITHPIISLPIFSLFVGGYLLLSSQSSPAQAEIIKHRFFITTSLSVYDFTTNQQVVPELEPREIVEFYENNQNFPSSQTTLISQSGENFQRYLVYVDSDNMQILEQVRQIEKTAYIRQFNGRNIIQSGVFSKASNAERRVRELELNGVSDARILNFSNQEPIAYVSKSKIPSSSDLNRENVDNFRNNVVPNIQENQIKAYYVIIPTSDKNLLSVGQEIKRKIGTDTNVFLRNQPRGTHIAVGSFKNRSEAQQWNNYLLNLGYKNARVYYGK